MKDDNAVIRAVGQRIQQMRKKRGYTQQKFAEKIGLSTNYLSDVERGNSSVRLEKLIEIMNALECSADEIFVDVLNNGFKIKSTQLSEKIETLSPDERKKIFALLDAFINN